MPGSAAPAQLRKPDLRFTERTPSINFGLSPAAVQDAFDRPHTVKLNWYAQRWKIETFHKILKSGCRAEESRLRTAERLVNLLALFSILSWRIFWMTMLGRMAPGADPRGVFTDTEMHLLQGGDPAFITLGHCIASLARLGGYLARSRDPPPGNLVIWRGLGRLADLTLGSDHEG